MLLCCVIKNQTKFLSSDKTKERIFCASLTIEISKPVFDYISSSSSSSLYSEYTTKTTKHVRAFLDFVQVASLVFLLLLLPTLFMSRCTHNFQDKNIRDICRVISLRMIGDTISDEYSQITCPFHSIMILFCFSYVYRRVAASLRLNTLIHCSVFA